MNITEYKKYFKVRVVFGVIVALLFVFFTSSFLIHAFTESHYPDSIENITNLSPNNVTVLQEDPDTIQNNWLEAVDQGLDTDLRVAFPAPINSLVEGANLQEFRIRVRKWDDGSAPNGIPSMDVFLYENGVEVLQLATGVAVDHSVGQTYSYTWDATELASTSGASVELRIFGATNGGGPNQSTLEVGAVEWNAEIEEPDLVQDRFRFYENRDDVTPTVELAGENEMVTAVAQDEVLRLRINAYGENGGIPQNYSTSTLQYAALDGVVNCSSVATSSFVSVGGIGTAEIWRGYSNATSSDGADLSSLLLSSSNVLGTYEEENPTALLPREAIEGERVEWDFVIQNNGAESNENYCFRLVKDGSEEFSRYNSFAEAKVVRGLTQVRYRWRNDDGNEISATWKEDENFQTTVSVDESIRLRVQLDNEGNVSDFANLRLEYATSTIGPWSVVPVDNPDCNLTASAFRICDSDFIDNNGTTTRQLSEIVGSDFIFGYTLDNSNLVSGFSFNVNEYTEIEWSIQATEGVTLFDDYFFRVSDAGEGIGSYSEFPKIKAEGDNASLIQNYYRWYENNDLLTPTNSWNGLGENTAITSSNLPPKSGEVMRLRMSLYVGNGFLPENSRSFKLQYAEREVSCDASENWVDVGGIETESVWRGTSTLATDGAELEELLLSVSDVFGTFQEKNPSVLNPNEVSEGGDVEYDWILEHNEATGDTSYCFRMVEEDGEEFFSYNYYPVLTTAGFTPGSSDWRWYGDAEKKTPEEPLSLENSAPVNIDFEDVIKLRVAVLETAEVQKENVKFALEFSESPSFSLGGIPVEEIDFCEEGVSLWCYAEGGGVDGDTISENLISSVDDCAEGVGDGCGTHNESGTSTSDFTHLAGALVEYEFTIRQAGALTNTGYYFRLVETESGEPVSTLESSNYPTVLTAGSNLSFSISGVPKGEIINPIITTDVETTPTSIPFGVLPMDERVDAAQRKTVETNAPGGFKIYMYKRNPFMSASGDSFEPINGNNQSPSSWSSGCEGLSSCYGYHVGDDTLDGGSTRFAPADSFSAFSQDPAEIGYSGIPDRSYSVDTVMSLEAREGQPAGDYIMSLVYIIVPIF